ncbi:DUF262 domain-containing HNH endonuclease family protein [Qipengyuania flava]|nr:DUF262 domain-containing HNH endonuclease family protein [Qipengyuania flava]
MTKIKDLFSATSASLWDTMMSHNGAVGFRIPEYQRTYDWSHAKIKRLLEDCLNGLNSLTNPLKGDPYTFLGSLILVTEKSKESTFDGTSLAVVDGQQRLTTMMLICVSLISAIKENGEIPSSLQKETQTWLQEEKRHQLEMLYLCAVGQLQGMGKIYPFPRLIRDSDNRARTPLDAEYNSFIAKFCQAFYDSYDEDKKDFYAGLAAKSASDERFLDNYKYIGDQIQNALVEPDYEKADVDFVELKKEEFRVKGIRDLFAKLDVLQGDAGKSRALDQVAKRNDTAGLIRLLAFSSFLTNNVVFTRVETDSEDAAFDIFDALNTTGEPLTALETFKPRVIREENDKSGFKGSESEEGFDRIQRNLNDIYEETDKRQKETKDLLVTFALYLDGHKLPLDLSSQRLYLRSKYDELARAKAIQDQRKFVSSIADVAEFRQRYWTPEGIRIVDQFHKSKELDTLKLCLLFLQDMKMTLSLPVIARYWVEFSKGGSEDEFIQAVKALTAFVVLRRAVTGGTGGIDSDLRRLMDKKLADGSPPLSVGPKHDNEIWSLQTLREELKSLLASKKLGISGRDGWVSQVADTALAKHSRPLSRFILLAAAHNSHPDQAKPGLLKRDGVVPSEEIAYLTSDVWNRDKYGTVEHIAPESNPGSGWDKLIYEKQTTRQLVGNLVLLPQKENSAVGNFGWDRKKLFYDALVSKTMAEKEAALAKAKTNGFQFTKKTENLLKEGERLRMLDSLSGVKSWDRKMIEARTRNMLELAWDSFADWLYK